MVPLSPWQRLGLLVSWSCPGTYVIQSKPDVAQRPDVAHTSQRWRQDLLTLQVQGSDGEDEEGQKDRRLPLTSVVQAGWVS